MSKNDPVAKALAEAYPLFTSLMRAKKKRVMIEQKLRGTTLNGKNNLLITDALQAIKSIEKFLETYERTEDEYHRSRGVLAE